ncbi:hypothetical protein [Falsirhodobacter deserti]|uniref:hypothetical protein n=1 Tax=Falsirhodobacter deserti TaxID=1365611 RepID=UPI000FE3A866|nr:hypothetical protein [Falsirhodobacter deserti]
MPTHLNILRRHVWALSVVALAAASPVLGQSANELAALRYYIQQNNQPAIEAEIRRLRSAFPDWQPPADLNALNTSADPGAETDRIYQLIAAGDVEGAQRALDAARTTHTDWTPPADMLALLDTATAQRQFDAAVSTDPARAVQIARTTPALTQCDRINNVWRLAEAQERAGEPDQARGAYEAILTACPRYQDIVGTLEKADSVTTPDQLAQMFATATARFPANAADLAGLKDRLDAGRGAGTATAAPPRSAPSTPPSASAPARAPQQVRPAAPQGGIAAPASQWDRLPPSGDGRITAMRAATAAGDWGRCIALTPEPRSLDLLNERGWCSLNLKRPMEALASFSAVAKGRVPAEVARDARYGMAMSYLNMNMSNDAAKISAATNFTRQQRVEVEHEILVQRGVEAYRVKDYSRAIGYLDAAEGINGLNRGLGVLRAYAYLNSGDRSKALQLFTQMHSQMAGDDTRRGMAASRTD